MLFGPMLCKNKEIISKVGSFLQPSSGMPEFQALVNTAGSKLALFLGGSWQKK
jgi:hypothetical protein